MSVDAVRYNGTIHDFVFINALRDLPSTQAAIRQASDGIKAISDNSPMPVWRSRPDRLRQRLPSVPAL